MNAYPVIHGGHTGDNRALLDGMQFNGEGQGRGFYFNPAAAQEASVQLGGQTAEFENGGFQANMVPKDGGNRLLGTVQRQLREQSMVSDNLTQELQRPRAALVNTTKRTYDANAAIGGPIVQDKLWFFTSHRVFGYQNCLADNWSNLTQNTPFYTPDLSRPASTSRTTLRRHPLHLSAVQEGQDAVRPGTSSTRTSAWAAVRWSRRKRPTRPNTPIRTTCCRASGRASSQQQTVL